MRCEDATRSLASMVDGSIEPPDEVRSHVEHCLRCQVDSIRYRRLGRAMRQLQDLHVAPGPDLVVDILAWIDAAEGADTSPSPRYRRAAYLAAAATAATAAGAAGALVIAARSRRGRLGLAG